jgi:glutaminase
VLNNDARRLYTRTVGIFAAALLEILSTRCNTCIGNATINNFATMNAYLAHKSSAATSNAHVQNPAGS